MQKNYCDRCGKELHHHEGYFIKPIKNYNQHKESLENEINKVEVKF